MRKQMRDAEGGARTAIAAAWAATTDAAKAAESGTFSPPPSKSGAPVIAVPGETPGAGIRVRSNEKQF